MKTIPQLSKELGIHRDTLRKAAKRDEFPNAKSGERAYIVDEESEQFKSWLIGRKRKKVQ